ncbi:GNAT family N-acetyltransferase [Proteiniphilum acetatigenes]|uniref:GNAT family N-acetyltransferase n=1 Tax=Proteiniphilum acetatigenes TaxID=294710 RepID=UPI0003778057|nr:GNAT family N-acetyltransferase [Proteiniphilum acetatigenes]SFK33767.1 diamine N-acetyltransferase [Porphyromonadaceae bacterium KH3CP3RA]
MNRLLENNILRLRAPEPEDLDLLYAWENDTAIWQNGASIVPFSRYSIKQYLIDYKHDIYVDKQLRLMVTLRETDECIGTVDLYDFDPFHRRAGVGILIDCKHRRKGYAVQALMLLEEYAFRFLNLRQLYAIIPEKNNSSIGLFAKTGYRQTGLLEEWLSSEDSFYHALIMQKLKL